MFLLVANNSILEWTHNQSCYKLRIGKNGKIKNKWQVTGDWLSEANTSTKWLLHNQERVRTRVSEELEQKMLNWRTYLTGTVSLQRRELGS